jgi:hypothetical protein
MTFMTKTNLQMRETVSLAWFLLVAWNIKLVVSTATMSVDYTERGVRLVSTASSLGG